MPNLLKMYALLHDNKLPVIILFNSWCKKDTWFWYILSYCNKLCLISECQVLDQLEKSSRTVKGANFIGQDNEALSTVLLPLKTWSKGSHVSLKGI